MSSTETKLQQIAEILNATSNNQRWQAFDSLCAHHDLTPDYDRQDRDDPECAYEMFVEGGWSLVVSCDEWCVSTPE